MSCTNRYSNHLFDMSAQWPTSWQGQTHMDCGADGQLLTTVGMASQPTGIHQRSFQAITDHWPTIWPEFRQCITELMQRCKQTRPDWKDVRVLHLSFPTNHSRKAASGVLAWFFHQQILCGFCRILGGSLCAKRHRPVGDFVHEKQNVEPPACTGSRDVVLFAFQASLARPR